MTNRTQDRCPHWIRTVRTESATIAATRARFLRGPGPRRVPDRSCKSVVFADPAV